MQRAARRRTLRAYDVKNPLSFSHLSWSMTRTPYHHEPNKLFALHPHCTLYITVSRVRGKPLLSLCLRIVPS